MFRRLFPFILFFPFLLNAQTAFISGNDTICDNASKSIIKVDFTGESPFIFSYSINGINQSSITTLNTTYLILTSIPGIYTLQSFNDIISVGTISGSAMVTVLESPTAIIHLDSDTLSVNYPIANFVSQSIGSIVSWDWNFGDNTSNMNTENPSHIYPQWPPTVYQVTLIVLDNMGCSDTAFSTITVGQPTTSIQEHAINKEHLKVTDLLGRETKGTKNEVLFYIYDDGTVEKRIIIE